MPTQLAPRELEYVQYVQQDLSDKQIARLMGVTPGTVQGTARRVRYKLHAASRIQVLINATREGIISLSLVLMLGVQITDASGADFERPAPRTGRTTRTRNSRTNRNSSPLHTLFDQLDDWTNGYASELYQSYDIAQEARA